MLKTPKLRFKDKNGNTYPEWEKRKIGDICKTFSGGTPSITNTSYYNGDIPFIKSGEIHSSQTEINITKEGLKNSSAKLVSKGDLLLALYGATSGEVDISKINGAINQAILCIRSENTNIFFLKNLFSLYKEQILCKYLQGGQGNLSAEIIKSLMFFLPCLEEQEKIAGFLSKVDELINECEGEVKDLEEQKKGLMQKIFSQQIRFKDSNNNPYPDWEEKKLYDITDVRDGTHDSPKYVAYGYPLITSKNLTKDGKLDFSDVSYITEQDYKEINKRSKVHVGDILFGMIGTIGKPVVIQEDNFAIKNVALIKNNQNNINRYLVHYLQSDNILRQFHVEIAGGTQKFIALGVIRNLIIKLPCLEEQEKIAKVLSKIDELIEEKKALLSDWQQFKKGLLQQMFV